MTVALSLFTPCLRHCMFCSIFTLLGALQVPTSFSWSLTLLFSSQVFLYFRVLLQSSSHSACLPTQLGGDLKRSVVGYTRIRHVVSFPAGNEALPLSAVLSWRMQNRGSILGCCNWHGNISVLLNIAPIGNS